MDQSTSFAQHTPTSAGQLQADTIQVQANARLARAPSTSSNGDTVSVATGYPSNASTYGSTDTATSRKRKLDETVEMMNGVDLVPRTAGTSLQSLRYEEAPHIADPKQIMRCRRAQSGAVTSARKGSQPAFRERSQTTQTSAQTLSKGSKRVRVHASSIELQQETPISSPTYAAQCPAHAVPDVDVLVQVIPRKQRAASLPLRYESLLSRKRITNCAARLAESRTRGHAIAFSQQRAPPLFGVPPATTHLTTHRINEPPVLVAPVACQPLPQLSHAQLATMHQLQLLTSSQSHLSVEPAQQRKTSGIPACRPVLQHSRSTSQSGGAPSIPSLRPPITKDTLRELDLQQVLKCRQLRHDVLFDADLVFRPSFDGDRYARSRHCTPWDADSCCSGDRKREAADRYWMALTRELAMGCRCTAFSFAPSATAMHNGHQATILPCICRTSADLLTRLPSRVTALAVELRDTLVTILPIAQGAEVEMEATFRAIRDTIDPELITQEAAHGVLDLLSLARFLVPIIKAHCAPMRDELVDCMLRSIEKGQQNSDSEAIGHGLRCCFSILEIMKLDIANHQLRVVRPYLLDNAADFERAAVSQAIGPKDISTALPKTEHWLVAAAVRQQLGGVGLSSRSLVQLVTDGVLELLFRPHSQVTKPRLPLGRSSRKSQSSRLPEPTDMPELLDLDIFRLQSLHSDVVDLAIMTLLILLFRQLCGMARRVPTPSEVANLKQEILILKRDMIARIGSRSIGSGLKMLENPAWREGMKDVVLQIACRAGGTGSAGQYVPSPSIMEVLHSWLEKNLVADSSLVRLSAPMPQRSTNLSMQFILITTRIRGVVFDRVLQAVQPVKQRTSVCIQGENEAALKKNGLADFPSEVQVLVERLAKLVSINSTTHYPFYRKLLNARIQEA